MFVAHNALMTAVFKPFNEENTNRTSQAIPSGASGCWVTLIGPGGIGGQGLSGINYSGGSGGGGGARINRVWIPRTSLGSTYSVTQGVGAISPVASVFTSGGITLTGGVGGAGW